MGMSSGLSELVLRDLNYLVRDASQTGGVESETRRNLESSMEILWRFCGLTQTRD